MHIYMSLFVGLLFVLLTPGVLLTLPKGSPKLTIAIVHGIVFAIAFHFLQKPVWNYFYPYERKY